MGYGVGRLSASARVSAESGSYGGDSTKISLKDLLDYFATDKRVVLWKGVGLTLMQLLTLSEEINKIMHNFDAQFRYDARRAEVKIELPGGTIPYNITGIKKGENNTIVLVAELEF